MTTGILKSDKVRLRALEPGDALMMYDIENDPEIWFYSERIAPLSMHAISRYATGYDENPFRAGQLRLVIETHDGDPCGLVDLYDINTIDRTAMVGIVIIPEYRCRGMARAALEILGNYARGILRLRALGARIAVSNIRSMHLFSQCGYIEVGRIPGWIVSPDGPVDMAILFLCLEKSIAK